MTGLPPAVPRLDAEERARVTWRVTLVGAVLNLVLTVAKVVIGVMAHSQALIADGIHSLSDLLSDGLVVWAAHHTRTGADARHPYGHGRFETAATLGLALILLLVAGGLVWDAVDRMLRPAELLHPGALALYVALVSVVSKEWLYHYTRRAAQRIRSDLMYANAWHHRSDAISSVVVLVGLIGTMAGLAYLDAVAAAIVGLMIAKIGLDLAGGALRELVDTGLETARVEAIRAAILSVGGVRALHMLRTRRLGGVAAADVHVLVEPRLSVSEGHQISLTVEQRLKREIDEVEDVTVHIDPEDDESSPPGLGLPLRAEALERLGGAWAGVPGAEARREVVLHYLSGRIDADVYFPLRGTVTEAEAARLAGALQGALAGHPEFRQVRIYFG